MPNFNREDEEWFEKYCYDQKIDQVAFAARSFQRQLLASQKQSSSRLNKMVAAQLEAMLQHASRNVDHYSHLKKLQFKKAAQSSALFRMIPTLTRSEVQSAESALIASELPSGHSIVGRNRSSGTTGNPIEISITNIFHMWQKALALRANIWARRDFKKDLAIIRKFPKSEGFDGTPQAHWGDSQAYPFQTGTRYMGEISNTTIEQQFKWLVEHQPAYLLTFPSLAAGLLAVSEQSGFAWKPKGIMALGESLTDSLRYEITDKWGIGVDDTYSAEECGVIALQCPSHGNYHIQSENLIVEVLDEAGKPCSSGKIGKVVITTLNNFASPLIRYEIGDYAIAGGKCGCGRVGPTLQKIIGRSRHLLSTKDGKIWPSFGFRKLRNAFGIGMYQARQVAIDKLNFEFTANSTLASDQITQIHAHIAQVLPSGMEISIRQVDEIKRPENGKIEVFINEMTL